MSEPISNGGAILVRLSTLERDLDRHDRRIEANAAEIVKLAYVPQQLQDIRTDILELKAMISDAAKAQKQTTEWWENFRLSNTSLNESKTQNVKTGYIAIITLGASLSIFVLGKLADVALRVVK